MASDDEDAAKRAEQNYQKILAAYQAEQRQPSPSRRPKAQPTPAPGGGVGAPPVLPPSGGGGNQPPKKTIQTAAKAVIQAGQAVAPDSSPRASSRRALSVVSCVTQPAVGSCLQAAAAVAGGLLSDGEGDAAFDVDAGFAAGPVDEEPAVPAIGRRSATKDFADQQPNAEVLNLPDDEWTLAKNAAWIQSIIDRGLDVLLVSPLTADNLVNSETGELRVFGREIKQLLDAGYRRDGNVLRAP